MRLILVRHALPVRLDEVSDAPDPALSATGHRQVAALVEALRDERIDTVYSSPLRRAVQTASPLAEPRGLGVRVHPGIAEFDFGHGNYIPAEERGHPVVEQMRARLDDQRGDEALTAFRGTVAAAMAEIIAATGSEDTAAVVCHGGVINAYAAHLVGTHDTIFANIAYTGFSIVTVSRQQRARLRSLNEHGHVRALERRCSADAADRPVT